MLWDVKTSTGHSLRNYFYCENTVSWSNAPISTSTLHQLIISICLTLWASQHVPCTAEFATQINGANLQSELTHISRTHATHAFPHAKFSFTTNVYKYKNKVKEQQTERSTKWDGQAYGGLPVCVTWHPRSVALPPSNLDSVTHCDWLYGICTLIGCNEGIPGGLSKDEGEGGWEE